MKNYWKLVKIGDIGEVVGGGTPSTKCSDYYGGDIPWITPKDLSNFRNRYISRGERMISKLGLENSSARMLPPFSVLFTSRAPIGYIAIAKNELCTNQGFKSIIPDPKKCNALFLYYLLKYKKNDIELIANGSTFQEVSGTALKNFEVSIPPLDEQRKIAGILSALDDKIELNNKINRNLEAQAQAIFKSWFVDFEPFKNGKFIDSELGKIPEYWQVVKFSEFLKPRIEKINNSTITEYSVTNSGIFKRDEKFKKRLSGAKTFNKIIYYADMVFGMSREILNWGLMRNQIGSVSSAYTVFSVNTELVDLSYLEFFMRYHHEYFKSIIRLASREGQGIDKAVLFNKCVIIPDTNAIARFLEILNSISNSRLAINEESRRLVQLRDALLPKLMSGEIDVANVAV